MAQTAGQQDADEFFKDKKALTISELAILLERHVQSRKMVDSEYEPNPLLKKTLEYSQHFASNRNEETTKRMRQFAEAEGLNEREFCMISNLGVQGADEGKKLIPTLEVSLEA